MQLIKLAFFSGLMFLLGCKKERHEVLIGLVNVNGQIRDIVSNEPIANCVVKLITVQLRPNGLGGYNSLRSDHFITDTTDVFGNYSFAINATGQYEFDISAEPANPLYVNSDYTIGQDETIKSVGTHTKDLFCHRSACAKVSVTNISPIDTPYAVILRSQGSYIVLNNYYRDTLINLKLVGRSTHQNELRFDKSGQDPSYVQVTVGPWDTISVNFHY